ncbi:MAG TPA: 2-phospho-L-lactate guanylyltransferase [Candidatus Dormibacteraeota bacterium]|nr:2-phospho-L-lactate guanylyltransferase [Candidatus Dormibacteraeota bacterium]
MGIAIETWVIVLIKDFGTAKQRLEPALAPSARQALARRNAKLAVGAAAAGDHVLVVAGGDQVAQVVRAWGAEALVEPRQEGQNVAARRGIERAVEGGAGAVLLLSSDLPLVSYESVRDLLRFAATGMDPVVIAVPAIGRGGTNALYLRPPGVVGLHFGDDSLTKFQEDAEGKGVDFLIHRSDAMALDLDEPSDLARLRSAV